MAHPGKLAAHFRNWIRAEAGMSRMMLVTFVALLTFAAALVGGFIHATNAADGAAQANERSLLKNHIDVSVRSLLAAENVQLTWDDAMRAAGGQNDRFDQKWADTFFGQFLTTMVHAQDLFLVKPDGTLLRAWRDGQPANPENYAPIAAATRRTLVELSANRSLSGRAARFKPLEDTLWPFDAKGHPLTRWSGTLVRYQGQPAIMTVVAITPDATWSLLRRTPNHMVAVRTIDAAMLQQIGNDVLLRDMRFHGDSSPDPQRNQHALTDRDGQALGWLSWLPNRVGPIVRARTVPLLVAYLVFYIIISGLGLIMLRGAFRMVRELAASEAQAQHLAMHDPMLGLPNRAHALHRLTAMLAEVATPDALDAARQDRDEETDGGERILIAYFDLDHFKAINESVGHHAGDDLLVQIVARVRARMRPTDVLGRLASDEFLFLRREPAGGKTAIDLADALGTEVMDIFAEPFSVFGSSVPISASCGIAWAPNHGTDAKTLLRNADTALFRSKQRGRRRYRRFTRDMDATIRWRQDLEVELRQAIVHDDLGMAYQPIVNSADGSIASFEALLRWHHRDRGEIGPGIFVPVAEQCGLMPQLGDWVLRRVFADSRDFGVAEISVNLSPLQLSARDFMDSLKTMIREEKVDPARFTFEITEGVLMENSERMIARLTELQDMGFRVALDDFGTGYSSLAYLRSFQFDHIKIDRSFVQGIESDIDAQSILRAIVALGRTLRMKVVAEGVETMHQQQLVQAAGCQLIQGHLHWRALHPDQVIAILATDKVQTLRMAV